MQIETHDVQGARIIRPHGRIDSSTSAVFEQAVKVEGLGRLLLDLSDVAFMSSAGLRVVLVAVKAARAAGGSFAVFGMTEAVKMVFHMSGFDRIIPAMETESEALAAVNG